MEMLVASILIKITMNFIIAYPVSIIANFLKYSENPDDDVMPPVPQELTN